MGVCDKQPLLGNDDNDWNVLFLVETGILNGLGFNLSTDTERFFLKL